MSRYTRLEIAVGGFVITGAAAIAFLSLTLGGLNLGPDRRYVLGARFSSAGDLKVGNPVKLAGVTVGEVKKIALVDFAAHVDLALEHELKLPVDTIASIRTEGLLGDAYVSLSPGASESDLRQGSRISRTEPAINILDLVAKYAFGSPVGADAQPKSTAPQQKENPVFSDPLE